MLDLNLCISILEFKNNVSWEYVNARFEFMYFYIRI